MLAALLARRLAARNIHYAWVVAALAFCSMLTTSAALGLPGALLLPLSREFGWTTDQISSALALRFVLFGLMAPFSAMLMERFGLRRVIFTALGLVGSVLLLSTQMTSLWHLFVLWGVILGIGSGLTAMVLGAVVANRWFTARRGLVMGMLTASTATGQLLFLPLAAWIIQHVGWRYAVLPVFCVGVVLATLIVLFIVDRPSSIGLRPYGETPGSVPSTGGPAVPATIWAPFIVLREAMRNRMFWILAGTFFICGLSTSGLIQTHFITMCADFGLEAVPAASVLAMMGAFDFIGTIASGWLSDRYDSRKLLFWYYGLRGLSLFWLPHSTFTLYGLSLFAVFYGLDWIATVPPTVRLAAQSFGRERAGLVFGWVFAAHQVGSAIAAWGGGLSRTILLSYSPAIYSAGAACIVAAVAVLLVSLPRREADAPVPARA